MQNHTELSRQNWTNYGSSSYSTYEKQNKVTWYKLHVKGGFAPLLSPSSNELYYCKIFVMTPNLRHSVSEAQNFYFLTKFKAEKSISSVQLILTQLPCLPVVA